jgi:hypothetical protein
MLLRDINMKSAAEFLNPDNFITKFDKDNPAYQVKQYNKGFEISNSSKLIFITATGAWGATFSNGEEMTAYERIGYHSCTADLLRGFLAGKAEIVVYRVINDNLEKFSIKEFNGQL